MTDDIQKALASESEKIGNAYYDESSRHMHMDDLIFNNRFKQSLNSLNFNSSSICNIPNKDFISDMFVSFRFPGVASVGANVMNLVPLAAYMLIDFIEIQIGGSTVYRQSGVNMIHDILYNADSKSKRDELIKLAGGAGSSGFTTAQTFYAYLNVPWSSIAAQVKKLPLDSLLFKQNASITLYLKSGNSVYYQSGGSALAIPSGLAEGEFLLRQGELKDPSKRLQLVYERLDQGSQQVVKVRDVYSYPFMYSQSFITSTFAGSTVGNPAAQVNLSGFQKGKLQGIRFMLYNATTSPLSYPSSSATNLIKTEEPLSFELFFNGQSIFRSRYDSWKMSNLLENNSSGDMSTTPSGTSYYSILVNVVDGIEKIMGETYQDGYDLASQTLVASLNTPTSNNYALYCTYLYHAHVICDGDNAEIKV